jgi:hypothetical protein
VEYGDKLGACVTGGYVTGRIWSLRQEAGRVTAHKEILRQPENIASSGEGPDDEIYVLAFNGRIYRLDET